VINYTTLVLYVMISSLFSRRVIACSADFLSFLLVHSLALIFEEQLGCGHRENAEDPANKMMLDFGFIVLHLVGQLSFSDLLQDLVSKLFFVIEDREH